MVNDNIIGRQRPDGYGSWNSAMDQAAGVAPAEFAAYTCNEEIVERFARSLGGENIRPSMLIAPSRLGSGVLRAQIPDNLAFTVTNGTSPNVNGSTRVGPNGLIETAKTNLALQSENLGTNWGLVNLLAFGSGSVLNTTATVDPYGNNSADLIVANVTVGQHRVDQSITHASGSYVFSVFLKAAGYSFAKLRFGLDGAVFNLLNGNTSGVSAGIIASSQNLGNGWYRCIIGKAAAVANEAIRINMQQTVISNDFAGDGTSGIYVFGAQYETGSVATTYIPTTTVARTRFAGVDVNSNVNTNAPRLDYLGQSCPGLLVEPAATNQIRNNSMVGANVSTNALPTNWLTTLNGLSIQVIAIGTETGVDYIDIKLSGTATSTVAVIAPESSTQIVAASGQTWTNSLYIKIISQPSPPSSYTLAFREGTSGGSFVNFGASAITPTTTLQRLSATRTLTGATTERVQPQINFALVSGSTYDFTVRIGWPQMEQSSVATSPIPTTSVAVTRNADVISASGALVSGLIGQTEGTMYWEGAISRIDRVIFSLAQGTSVTNCIYLQTLSNGFFRADVLANNSSTCAIQSLATATLGQFYKIAFAYKENDFALYINGVLQGSDNLGALPSGLSNAIFARGDSSLISDQRCRAAALYTTRLSNEQLMLLTSPTYYGDIADMSWAYYLNRSGESVPSCLQTRNYQLLQV